MPRRLFAFDDPDRFATGTIGEPGNRTFFLQARSGERVVSVVIEKTQVSALAERLGQLLVELDRQGVVADPSTPIEPDERPLDEPLNEAFRTGSLTLGWDGQVERILVEARAQIEVESVEEAIEALQADDDDEDGPDLLRVHLTADAARSFVERANRVVRAGRPTCPLCGNPLDPGGHICPRKNGQYVN
ncbi:MAG TPA: DUF3090 domain-containing protein [Candidatus Limnocylindrales bacterium]|nr:DUF3090 domain-containing protein [Candidatus Limnocylindrales bacterium]